MRWSLLLLVAVMASVGVQAEDSDYYSSYLLQVEFKKQLHLAKQGDATAQYEVATMYLDGRGVKRDRQAGLDWLRKAVDQDHMQAHHKLGTLYFGGQGVKRDYQRAREYFETAAQAGYGPAQYYMGRLYADGLGVDQNLDRAIDWLNKAKARGYPAASQELARLRTVKEERAAAARERREAQRRARQARLRAERQEREQAEEQARSEPEPPARETDSTHAAEPDDKKASAETTTAETSSGSQTQPEQTPTPLKRPSYNTQALLLGHQWIRGGKPARRLPSKDTRCNDEEVYVVCRSPTVTQQTADGKRDYYIQTVMMGFSEEGRFRARYRWQLSVGGDGSGATEEGAFDAQSAGRSSTWQDRPHPLRCHFQDERHVVCSESGGEKLVFTRR